MGTVPPENTKVNIHDFEYCPLCGSKIELEEISIEWKPNSISETNQVVTCPEHGVLIT